jgi:hypothetical protein
MSRQCGILNISQSYRPARPIAAIALLFIQEYFANRYMSSETLELSRCLWSPYILAETWNCVKNCIVRDYKTVVSKPYSWRVCEFEKLSADRKAPAVVSRTALLVRVSGCFVPCSHHENFVEYFSKSTSGGRSVGIVRSRTKCHGVCLFVFFYFSKCQLLKMWYPLYDRCVL